MKKMVFTVLDGENEMELKNWFRLKGISTRSVTRLKSYGSILLNGKNEDPATIQGTIKQIINAYDKGAPFEFLAKKYSVANNANRGGDTGWFGKEEVPTVFCCCRGLRPSESVLPG